VIDLDLIWGKKTENWFVGAFKCGNIYILNSKILRKSRVIKRRIFTDIKT